MKEERSNLYSAIVFVLFGIFVYIGSFWIPVTTSDILGSRFFPRAVAVLIFILGIVQFAMNVKILKNMKSVQENQNPESEQSKKLNWPLLLTVISLFIYYVLLLQIGFVITSILYLLVQSAVLMSKEDFGNKKKVVIMILVSVIVPIAINAVFWNVFSIALPGGKLF